MGLKFFSITVFISWKRCTVGRAVNVIFSKIDKSYAPSEWLRSDWGSKTPEMNDSRLILYKNFDRTKKYLLRKKLELPEVSGFSKISRNLRFSYSKSGDLARKLSWNPNYAKFCARTFTRSRSADLFLFWLNAIKLYLLWSKNINFSIFDFFTPFFSKNIYGEVILA